MIVKLLSGGAAQGVVEALSAQFKAETGAEISASFGAVGGMRDRLLGGEPADLFISTREMVEELRAAGRLTSVADLGAVVAGLAVRAGEPKPDVSTPDALRAALRAADGIYFPDPFKSTAGIHFGKVLERLGVRDELKAKLRIFPNGATAMKELARSTGRAIGSTQATEMFIVEGLSYLGPLPGELGLASVYAAGICAGAAEPELARKLAGLLTGEGSRAVRERLGYSVK